MKLVHVSAALLISLPTIFAASQHGSRDKYKALGRCGVECGAVYEDAGNCAIKLDGTETTPESSVVDPSGFSFDCICTNLSFRDKSPHCLECLDKAGVEKNNAHKIEHVTEFCSSYEKKLKSKEKEKKKHYTGGKACAKDCEEVYEDAIRCNLTMAETEQPPFSKALDPLGFNSSCLCEPRHFREYTPGCIDCLFASGLEQENRNTLIDTLRGCETRNLQPCPVSCEGYEEMLAECQEEDDKFYHTDESTTDSTSSVEAATPTTDVTLTSGDDSEQFVTHVPVAPLSGLDIATSTRESQLKGQQDEKPANNPLGSLRHSPGGREPITITVDYTVQAQQTSKTASKVWDALTENEAAVADPAEGLRGVQSVAPDGVHTGLDGRTQDYPTYSQASIVYSSSWVYPDIPNIFNKRGRKAPSHPPIAICRPENKDRVEKCFRCMRHFDASRAQKIRNPISFCGVTIPNTNSPNASGSDQKTDEMEAPATPTQATFSPTGSGSKSTGSDASTSANGKGTSNAGSRGDPGDALWILSGVIILNLVTYVGYIAYRFY